jgi:transcriptional regulator with XRE-family HTH domain
MPKPSVFGRRLREARELRNLSQADLAAKSGVPVAMISHFETGVRGSASADNLVKFSDALELSIDYLLGRTETTEPSGGAVEAALRSLEDQSASVLEAVISMAESLSARRTRRRP